MGRDSTRRRRLGDYINRRRLELGLDEYRHKPREKG